MGVWTLHISFEGIWSDVQTMVGTPHQLGAARLRSRVGGGCQMWFYIPLWLSSELSLDSQSKFEPNVAIYYSKDRRQDKESINNENINNYKTNQNNKLCPSSMFIWQI